MTVGKFTSILRVLDGCESTVQMGPPSCSISTYLQHELNIHYAKIKGSVFVHGEGNERTYSIHQSRSTREAVEEYKSRRSRNDESYQEEMKTAV